jgi:hypothetical protein
MKHSQPELRGPFAEVALGPMPDVFLDMEDAIGDREAPK